MKNYLVLLLVAAVFELSAIAPERGMPSLESAESLSALDDLIDGDIACGSSHPLFSDGCLAASLVVTRPNASQR